MTTIPEKSAALIDRVITDVGLELPDRITCGWQEAIDGLVAEARAEERAWFVDTLRAELPVSEDRAVLVMRVKDRSRGEKQ